METSIKYTSSNVITEKHGKEISLYLAGYQETEEKKNRKTRGRIESIKLDAIRIKKSNEEQKTSKK